jgi:hypothetical protein
MCDDLGIDNNKVITYSLSTNIGSGFCVSENIDAAVEMLKAELENTTFDDDDEPITFTIAIEKKYTQKDLNEMGEFDGF